MVLGPMGRGVERSDGGARAYWGGGVERSDGGARAYGEGGWRGQTVVLGPMGRGGEEVRRWC